MLPKSSTVAYSDSRFVVRIANAPDANAFKFGSQPESIEDASDLYLEAARATIDLVEGDDVVAQDVQRLLEHLDNDLARVETLLAEMLTRRDHWLRHLHGKDRDELESALKGARHGALERLCNLCSHYPVRCKADSSSLCNMLSAI